MKRIAITMGDPGGIGPEIALRAAAATMKEHTPILVGDTAVLMEAYEMITKGTGALPFSIGGEVKVIDTGGAKGYIKNKPSKEGGSAAYSAIVRATEMALAGDADAVVTAPISKEALQRAGHDWPGHTELLAHLTGSSEFAMMLVGGGLRVMLVTIHEAIRDVPPLITKDNVLRTLKLAHRACDILGIEEPRIAVCGLNPHAGEGGLFGLEEKEAIGPAIEAARAEGIPASGPYPADSLFFRAHHGLAHKGEFDLVVSMYHDQGLVPLKLLGFETGVNITVGLPIIRTSPDHGTAFDIAWKAKADPSSMVEAVRLAASISS